MDSSLGSVLIVGAMLVGAFWVVGKIFIKAMKILLVAALGLAVVGAIFLSPVFVLYGVIAGAFGLWHMLSPRKTETSDYDDGNDNDEY